MKYFSNTGLTPLISRGLISQARLTKEQTQEESFQQLIRNARDPDFILKSKEAADGQDVLGKRSRLQVLTFFPFRKLRLQ